MSKQSELQKSKQINLRVYPQVKTELERLASINGQNVTQYLTRIITDALHRDGAQLSVLVDLAKSAERGEQFSTAPEPVKIVGDPIAELAKAANAKQSVVC